MINFFKKNWGLFLSFLIAILYNNAYFFRSGDSEVYKYVSYAMSVGERPYINVFDHKTPVIYYLEYILRFFGENSTSIWTTTLFLISIAIFYLALIKNEFKYSNFTIIFFTLIAKSQLYFFDTSLSQPLNTFGLTYELAMYLGVISISLSLLKKYFLSSLLLGIIFWTQPQIFISYSLLIIFVYILNKKTPLKFNSLFLGLSLGLLIIPFISYFGGYFREMLETGLLFNQSKYVIRVDQTFYQKLISGVIAYSKYDIFLIIIGTLTLIFLITKNIKKNNLNLWLMAIVLILNEIFLTSLGGRFFAHYFLNTVVVMFLFCLIVVRFECFDSKIGYPIIFLTFSVRLLSLLIFIFSFKSLLTTKDQVSWNNLVSVQNNKGQLYIIGSNESLYMYERLKTTSPTKYVYTHFF